MVMRSGKCALYRIWITQKNHPTLVNLLHPMCHVSNGDCFFTNSRSTHARLLGDGALLGPWLRRRGAATEAQDPVHLRRTAWRRRGRLAGVGEAAGWAPVLRRRDTKGRPRGRF